MADILWTSLLTPKSRLLRRNISASFPAQNIWLDSATSPLHSWASALQRSLGWYQPHWTGSGYQSVSQL